MIKVPFLKYDDIHEKAEEFLRNFHPSRILPIPIDEIIDVKMGIHVAPKLGLHGEIGQVGFLSADHTTIFIDEYIYDNIDVRYRFTLAHEIGHMLLHKNIYDSYLFKSPDAWKTFQKDMPERERSWFEWQADCFAGLALVPREELHSKISDCIRKVDSEDISLRDNWDFAWDYIAKEAGRVFNVSAGTIKYRIGYDAIKGKYS